MVQNPPVLRISFPLPPSINQQYATVKNRRVLSQESRKYKENIKKFFLNQELRGNLDDQTLQLLRKGFLGLFIDFYFETPLRRDLDGGLKIVQDSICEALKINDNRVVDIHLVKRIDPLNPRIEIQLESIVNWQFDTLYEEKLKDK